jgi:hypothetical protein
MRMTTVYLDKEPLETGSVYYHEDGVLLWVPLEVFLHGRNDIEFLIREK